MRPHVRRSAVVVTAILVASGVWLTGCSAGAVSPAGSAAKSSSTAAPKSTPTTQPTGPCSAAVAAAFIADLDAAGDKNEVQIPSSSYQGPASLPGLTAGLTPSCVFRGTGSQDAIFLGASFSTYQKFAATLSAAGFEKIGGTSTASGFIDKKSGTGTDVSYSANGSAYRSDMAILTTPFVSVSG